MIYMIEGKMCVAKRTYYNRRFKEYVYDYFFHQQEYLVVKFIQMELRKFNYLQKYQYYCEEEDLSFELMEMTKNEMEENEWYDSSSELSIFSDINGNQYVLSKKMYCTINNMGVAHEHDKINNINQLIPRLLLITRRLMIDPYMTNLIARMAYTFWRVDPFTAGATRDWVQYYRIHPVARRSYEIHHSND